MRKSEKPGPAVIVSPQITDGTGYRRRQPELSLWSLGCQPGPQLPTAAYVGTAMGYRCKTCASSGTLEYPQNQHPQPSTVDRLGDYAASWSNSCVKA